MPFQSTVSLAQGSGVPGEIYANSPTKCESFILNSGSAANNIFGNYFTVSSAGVAAAGGTGPVAGFLVNPKGSASYGTSGGGPLAPTLTLANNVQAEILSQGTIFATNTNPSGTANVGDLVVYNTTTGVLRTIAPGAALPGGFASANAYVDYTSITAPGIMIITANPVTPVSA